MKRLNIIIIIALFIISTNYTKAQNSTSSSTSKFALKVNMGPLLTKIKSDLFPAEERSEYGFNIGADLIYYYFNNGKIKANVSLGIGMTNYQASRRLNYAGTYTEMDYDNQMVNITETANNLVEYQNLEYMDIPLKFGFDFTMTSKLDAYLSIGATYGFKLKGMYDSKATLTRTGFYPDFNALLYDIDVAGSPYFYPQNKRMISRDNLALKNNLSLESALGVKYRFHDIVSAFVGIKYMHGFSNVIDEKGESIVRHDAGYNYSLNSVSFRNGKSQTSGMGIEIGLQFKLGK